MEKLRWGILGSAKIAREHLIPAIQKSEQSEVVAIASRSLEKANQCAREFNIPKAYGCYEDLLADAEVDIVYNPMPNHMHVPWTIKSMQAGKHVLCEKPLGLTAKDMESLILFSQEVPHLKVMEAFMYRFHPQWHKAKAIVDSGELGEIKLIDAIFTYNSFDPNNVRYQKEIGGGALLDVGCYCISASRYLFAREPKRVVGTLEQEPSCDVDRHVSGLLDFGQGVARFSSSMQVEGTQSLTVMGTKGRMVIESPFFLPAHKQSVIRVTKNGVETVFTFSDINHYVCQVNAIVECILAEKPTPTPLADAYSNMKVMDALFKSGYSNQWEQVND